MRTGRPRHTKEQTIQSFNSKVDKSLGLGPQGTCWEWRGGFHQNGYGGFAERCFSGKQKSWKAHRFAFFIEHGRVPEKLALHSCDNKKCVNPAHLWDGTQKENIADMYSKGRQNQMPGALAMRKVDDSQVLQIRREYDALPEHPNGRKKDGGVQKIATRYGVNHALICGIGKRKIRLNAISTEKT